MLLEGEAELDMYGSSTHNLLSIFDLPHRLCEEDFVGCFSTIVKDVVGDYPSFYLFG